jgi:hypothetical protein
MSKNPGGFMHPNCLSAVVSALVLTLSAPYAAPNGPSVIADFGELVRHLESGGSVAVVIDLGAVGLAEEYGVVPDEMAQVTGFTPADFTVYSCPDRAEGYNCLILISAATLVNTLTTSNFKTTAVKVFDDGAVEINLITYRFLFDSFVKRTVEARLATTSEDPAGVYIYRR